MARFTVVTQVTAVALLTLILVAAFAPSTLGRPCGGSEARTHVVYTAREGGHRGSTWVPVARLHKSNNGRWNSDYETPWFTAKTGKMKVTWRVTPLQKTYNWCIQVYRKGQDPNVSGELYLCSDQTYGSGLPDSGSKRFKVKHHKQHRLWIEIWHCEASVVVYELR